jgi:hypothetical protein
MQIYAITNYRRNYDNYGDTPVFTCFVTRLVQA